MSEPLPTVPLSALEHHTYCPRQCALIHVDGVWVENRWTVRGERGHRRVDAATESRSERGRQVVRAMPLWSERHGLTGRADVVEFANDGTIFPIEYKMGVPHGNAAHIQLCAQALCLEEMFTHPVRTGAIWLQAPRRRIEVDLDAELRAETMATIAAVRVDLVADRLPPAPNDERCTECQLLDHCQPELVQHSRRVGLYVRETVWGG